jgi:hypothetical protein
MATDCASQNQRALEGPGNTFRHRLSRRELVALAAFGALLPMIFSKQARALPDANALVEHQGWVLRADDLQRLGIK